LWLLLAACGAQVSGDNAGGVDAPPVTGDDADTPLGPWSTPAPVPGANGAVDEDDSVLARSSLEMIFAIEEADGRKHLYRMTRSSPQDAFGVPMRMAINVDGADDQTPRLSADDRLYFASSRTGAIDVYEATRGADGDFTGATLVPGVNDTDIDRWFAPCDGGRYLMISRRNGDNDEDIFEGVLDGGAPTIVSPVSSGSTERGLVVSRDCLTMHFASNVSGAFELYTSTRAAITDPWGAPARFDDFAATGGEQEDPFLAEDGRAFLFTSTAAGSKDVYLSTR
jgi:hypothetical protein